MSSFKNACTTTYNVAITKRYSKKISGQYKFSVVDLFHTLLIRNSDGYIAFNDRRMTYQELDKLSNKIAHWGIAIGLSKGDIIPLMLDNCPEYIAVWLGLAKIGVAASLINTNLTGDALSHCIGIALDQFYIPIGRSHTVIIGNNYKEQIEAIKDKLAKTYNIQYCGYEIDYGDYSNSKDKEEGKLTGINATIHDHLDKDVSESYRNTVTYNDPIFYIYTSGTTGLPKAAKISHLRFAVAGYAFKHLYSVTKNDNIYIPLPLYHSNGGMLAVSLAWQAKTNIAIRRRFSATNYFLDCQTYKCSVGIYIGEICRYIVKTPATINDLIHPVRLMIGNGLRPDIWPTFVKRFGVTMGEFYGSTEGNANLFNTTGKIGAIGYLPWLLRLIYPVKIVKYDKDTGKLIRNDQGLCQECKSDEVGEAVGLIDDRDATRRFDGYSDKSATEKKIARNVFKPGDKWFRSGDLLKIDKSGYIYFVDRVGDTFRWKGENIATTEVSEVVTKTESVLDSNVYGVGVVGNEGKIGMVAIRLQEGMILDFENLYANVTDNLPKYARPYFLRILETVDMTGTFKYKKVELSNEGYNPETVKGQLYVLDDAKKTYVSLTPKLHQMILSGDFIL